MRVSPYGRFQGHITKNERRPSVRQSYGAKIVPYGASAIVIACDVGGVWILRGGVQRTGPSAHQIALDADQRASRRFYPFHGSPPARREATGCEGTDLWRN